MPVPVTKAIAYQAELNDPSRPLLKERAEWIIADLNRELRAGSPDPAAAHDILALIYGRTGEYHKSIEHYREAERVGKFVPFRIANMATSMWALGQHQEAAVLLLETLEKTPFQQGTGYASLALALVMVLFRMGHIEDALKVFEGAEKTASLDAPSSFRLASVAAIMGLTSRAVVHFARFLCLREGKAIDDARASEIVTTSPSLPELGDVAAELDRIVRIHKAFVEERQRPRTVSWALPEERDSDAEEDDRIMDRLLSEEEPDYNEVEQSIREGISQMGLDASEVMRKANEVILRPTSATSDPEQMHRSALWVVEGK